MTTHKNLGLLTADEYVERRSVTLIKNPNARLEEKFEINNYLSKLDPEYLNGIRKLSIDQQPLSKDARMLITIVAYGEGTRIRKALDGYLNQDLPRNKFEVIVLDNHPESSPKDNTAEEVKNFKQDNPDISVVYLHKAWTKNEHATVGNARKHVFDVALTRIYDRGESEKDTILISNDADGAGMDKNYLSSILEEFDSNPAIDGLVTSVVVPKNVIVKPNLFAVLSLWDVLDNTVAHGEPYNLRGLSSAYRSSIYSAVGGYNPSGKMAGDLETGTLIADARNWNPGSIIQFTKTKLIQDPRRILTAMASRAPVNEMYFDFVSKPEIRNADNNTLLSLIPEKFDWELFEEDADSFWQGRGTGMYKWRGERFISDFKEAMREIGIEYEIVNDRVKIRNVDKLLLKYKNEFGEEVGIIHSPAREWDPKRQNDMKLFFSGVSDGIISARSRMSEKIAKQIKNLDKEKKSEALAGLLASYKRFAGIDYQE